MRVRCLCRFFLIVFMLFSGFVCYSMQQHWKDYFEKTYHIPPNGSSSVKPGRAEEEEFYQVDSEEYDRVVEEDYQEFLENPPDVVEKDGVILFSDIRNFTDLCDRFSRYDREKSQSVWIPFYCKFKGKFFLNEFGRPQKFTIATFVYFYQNVLHSILRKNGGEIKNYMGDGIFAGFFEKNEKLSNFEEMEKNYCDGAMESGIAMIDETRNFEVGNDRQGWTKLRCGVGIHMGTISILQRENRLIHISGALNACARVEQLTKCLWMYKNPTHLPLLITKPVFDRLQYSFKVFTSYKLEPFLKGIGRYLLYGWDGSKPQKNSKQGAKLSWPMFPFRPRKREEYSRPPQKKRKRKKKRKKTQEELLAETLQITSWRMKN